MRCSGFPVENYGFYSLRSLSGQERDEIQQHLREGCETCLAELTKSREIWTYVGLCAPRASPRRSLRRRILLSIGGLSSWWQVFWFPVAGVAAALALAVVGGWILGNRQAPLPAPPVVSISPVPPPAISPPQQVTPSPQVAKASAPTPAPAPVVVRVPDPETEKLLAQERQRTAQLEAALQAQKAPPPPAPVNNREVETLTSANRELERELAQYKLLLERERKLANTTGPLNNLLSDPSLRLVKLRGTEKDQRAAGHAFLASNSRLVFSASGLPPLPAGRTYQLWLIRSQAPAVVSAGTFAPGALVQFQNAAVLNGVTTLAVTDEPAGGSPSPTGHKWLVGF